MIVPSFCIVCLCYDDKMLSLIPRPSQLAPVFDCLQCAKNREGLGDLTMCVDAK